MIRCSSCLEAAAIIWFSSSQFLALGTGSPSTPPFSCPSPGLQNSDSKPHGDRKPMNRAVSSLLMSAKDFLHGAAQIVIANHREQSAKLMESGLVGFEER